MGRMNGLDVGVYLTVTSIGVCDGGECFYPTQFIQHVSTDTVRTSIG